MKEPTDQPTEGLWSSLRRRKVVQWGIAYVAAAHVVLDWAYQPAAGNPELVTGALP